MSPQFETDVLIRAATEDVAHVYGKICYDAFAAINQQHGFPSDFPDATRPVGLLSKLFSNPDFYCVVAEVAGRIAGSNCLDERSIIAGVGPITIDPSLQNRGIGCRLMQALIDRANERGAAGIRLVQAGFHTRSLSLYASLGFDVGEYLACMQGRTTQRNVAGSTVRAAQAKDIPACASLSIRVHGFDRSVELPHAISEGTARVVEREGRITGCAMRGLIPKIPLAEFGNSKRASQKQSFIRPSRQWRRIALPMPESSAPSYQSLSAGDH
jgi:GNAT superfamily N-acetyltransferase